MRIAFLDYVATIEVLASEIYKTFCCKLDLFCFHNSLTFIHIFIQISPRISSSARCGTDFKSIRERSECSSRAAEHVFRSERCSKRRKSATEGKQIKASLSGSLKLMKIAHPFSSSHTVKDVQNLVIYSVSM